MAMTEHRTVASVVGYFHVGEAPNNPAAHLLDGAEANPITATSNVAVRDGDRDAAGPHPSKTLQR